MSLIRTAAVLTVLAGIPAVANASIVFEDNFNTERNGVGALNYGGFSKWTVSNGTVDLIGNGYFDFIPGNGLFLDLDGSTGNAGRLTSIPITLPAGQYEFAFDLGGNHRNSAAESVSVSFGNFYAATLSRTQWQDFVTETFTFTVPQATSASIVFDHAGGDNMGLLLDNVRVTSVPGPGAAGLALIAGAIMLRRRKHSRA